MREELVDIATSDGAMETFVCRPERGGPWPAVFFLMDAPGIREEIHDMARRLATVGYFVMLPNLYYRAGRDTRYGPGRARSGEPGSPENAVGPDSDDHPSGHGRHRRSCSTTRPATRRPRTGPAGPTVTA